VRDENVELMLAFCAGDGEAFDALFRRWSAPLLRFLNRMVWDLAVAEELVQEVFLRVYRSRDRYSPDARFSTWLYRIATNLALNELRRPRHRAIHQSADAEGAAPIRDVAAASDEVVHARQLSDIVEAEMKRLPDKQRAALWLAAVEGLSYAEVADTLDVSEKAVKALVHRARTALAAKLPERDC
jgi:RNA polymerase sigma-70 factor (ECF subfamily)